ncbi:MAG: efflux RND transporter periplasmic adaptor subunit [Micavibrio aeruginosavorus]|uniref:Efflux RND transporter periplasmic adaptor subunit n=1 Tax=Micavibrio aeruginosavorus TaxID=349221 RepID=A0A7T5UGR7_9BACT|nr:MAG: efflux RND transporter periplasmic adaptor subunit [Micavibrio aeruginosavorus]
MRVFIFFLWLLAFAVPAMAEEKGEPKILYWYDPMVPGQKFDKPGKSPYMDMDLVPFYEVQADGHDAHENSIQIDSSYRQTFGVKTATVRMEEFGRSIRAFGTVTPETRREHIVAVRTGGWISDLKTNAVGDMVKKGDLLFTFYSPDLLSAQSDYLVGQKGGRIAGASRQRLRLYGMDEKSIAELEAKGVFLEQTPFYAPADGTVTTLNVRKGSYVDPEQLNTVLALQDFSQVWIEAYVPVKDVQFLSAGTPASITVDETGQAIKAVTEYVYPMTDAESRKAMVRLVVENPEGLLKTGSLVNVLFDAGSRPRLAVPAESILYGKGGGYVIEDLGDGYFRPVAVQTGITAQGMTEIVSGLKDGQSIVTSGQFMIDAESNLRGVMAGMDKGDNHAH